MARFVYIFILYFCDKLTLVINHANNYDKPHFITDVSHLIGTIFGPDTNDGQVQMILIKTSQGLYPRRFETLCPNNYSFIVSNLLPT